jgi:hypothetical protein
MPVQPEKEELVITFTDHKSKNGSGLAAPEQSVALDGYPQTSANHRRSRLAVLFDRIVFVRGVCFLHAPDFVNEE